MIQRTVKQIAVAILIFAAGAMAASLSAEKTAAAVATQFGADSQCVASVPRAWGEYKGGSNQAGLAFQAPDGTLRFVTNLPCGATPVVALKVIRTGNGSQN
jgi:hypothetical protein